MLRDVLILEPVHPARIAPDVTASLNSWASAPRAWRQRPYLVQPFLPGHQHALQHRLVVPDIYHDSSSMDSYTSHSEQPPQSHESTSPCHTDYSAESSYTNSVHQKRSHTVHNLQILQKFYAGECLFHAPPRVVLMPQVGAGTHMWLIQKSLRKESSWSIRS